MIVSLVKNGIQLHEQGPLKSISTLIVSSR